MYTEFIVSISFYTHTPMQRRCAELEIFGMWSSNCFVLVALITTLTLLFFLVSFTRLASCDTYEPHPRFSPEPVLLSAERLNGTYIFKKIQSL